MVLFPKLGTALWWIIGICRQGDKDHTEEGCWQTNIEERRTSHIVV